MRKIIGFAVIIACAIILTGCFAVYEKNGKADDEKDKQSVETADNNDEDADNEQKGDPLEPYYDILDEYYYCLVWGESDPDLEDEMIGAKEKHMNIEPGYALMSVGFILKDVNNDGVEELLIGEADFGDGPDKLLSAYTLVDNKPKLLFQGWSRNWFYLTADGGFYHGGSSGAASHTTILYTLSKDNELVCNGHYYTEPKTADWSEIGYYYSKTEDRSMAIEFPKEKLDELYPEFSQWESSIQSLNFTDFTMYTVSEKYRIKFPPVTAKWECDVQEDISQYKAFHSVQSSGLQKVVFYAQETVTDFKVLELSWTGVDENNKAIYSVNELYCLDELTPGEPFVVSMIDYEFIPRNGFSYVDERGKLWRFSISQSGKDGTIILEQF